ncbi:hypothetical protein B0H63DRAFT_519398 [Podospora didyma]|uniref:Uncharacterized protein n=1 Tax=Podospora didyma TaxID=330526 RepID=A0AAE0NYU1_9PEZI|nr:hypothetical protein B0H63DRAFT_519398 [Podospora didyma]
MVFIVPRSERILLLRGISESDQWYLDYTLDSPIIQRIKAPGCGRFGSNVRVERELRRLDKAGSNGMRSTTAGIDNEYASTMSRIVHSYGHGGPGWSLSFGCAGDVVKLVEEILAGIPPKPMGGTE